MLTPAPSWLIERPISHRGLHNLSIGHAENSLGAFKAAVAAGYAIECDLQVSKSGEPMVFHDATLKRMTGIDAELVGYSPKELAEMVLLETEDTIHTLREHLAVLDGKVPLLLELKANDHGSAGLVEGVADSLKGYDGPVCLMSFRHDLCAQFAKILPELPRGLTAQGNAEWRDTHTKAMREYDLQFVSYDIEELPTPFVAEMRDLGLPIITWTVRSDDQVKRTFEHADQMTFEGFLPPVDAGRDDR